MAMDIEDADKNENERAHAALKMMVMQQIASQEATQDILKSIFRKIRLIYIIISAVILICIVFLIYVESLPNSKASVALKEMENLNTRITMQRMYIEMDRKDLEKTREAVNKLIKIQDSIIK
jgi:hypothetical protein